MKNKPAQTYSKNQKEKYYLMTIISGILLILLGIFYYFTNQKGFAMNEFISLFFIIAGTIIASIAVLKFGRLGYGLNSDKKIRMMGSYSLSLSWIITFILITVLFWFDHFNLIEVNILQYYSIIFSVMIISAVFFQIFLNRK